MKKILFICKRGESYSKYNKRFSGLYNSTNFIVDALNTSERIFAENVEVTDNNCIDKHVTRFRPDIVVIEALWVVPEKFKVLKKLHPNVKWFVHLHSDIPFLSMEGMAINWLHMYPYYGVGLITNSKETKKALQEVYNQKIYLLENCYQLEKPEDAFRRSFKNSHAINIGCFGAIRPMKNQLIQAMAAIKFAHQNKKVLFFYINSTRVEGGENILKNLRALFKHNQSAHLVEYDWHHHDKFLKIMSNMHVSMQVSYSETFNVVTADAVSMGVPVVVSDEIEWVNPFNKVKCDKIDSIVSGLERAVSWPFLNFINRIRLKNYVKNSRLRWIDFVLKI